MASGSPNRGRSRGRGRRTGGTPTKDKGKNVVQEEPTCEKQGYDPFRDSWFGEDIPDHYRFRYPFSRFMSIFEYFFMRPTCASMLKVIWLCYFMFD